MPSYVLVDKNQMAITHKYSDREVLAQLSWIECLNDAAVLSLGNVRLWFDIFTANDLRKIYQNATGYALPAYGTSLAQACHDMAMRLPDSVVNPVEVRAQYVKVPDGSRNSYEYQPGYLQPKEHIGTFERDPIKVERSELEEKRAQGPQPSFNNAPSAPLPGDTANANPFNVVPPTPRAPGAPRTGGVKEIVFKIADEFWEKAGKPTDLQAILQLRKIMMAALEAEHGVKKTTSSTTLGAWQKERLQA